MITKFNEYYNFNDKDYQNISQGNWYNEVGIGEERKSDWSVDIIDSSNWDRFTDSEVKQISDLFNHPLNKLYWMRGSWYPINHFFNIHQPSEVCFLMVQQRYVKIDIYKLKDEWFYISKRLYRDKYYKCDQIGGLIQCIKDNII